MSEFRKYWSEKSRAAMTRDEKAAADDLDRIADKVMSDHSRTWGDVRPDYVQGLRQEIKRLALLVDMGKMTEAQASINDLKSRLGTIISTDEGHRSGRLGKPQPPKRREPGVVYPKGYFGDED